MQCSAVQCIKVQVCTDNYIKVQFSVVQHIKVKKEKNLNFKSSRVITVEYGFICCRTIMFSAEQ